jgi:arylsulfatase
MSMTRVICLSLMASFTAVMAAIMPAAAQQQQRPNIVIIWGDDVGPEVLAKLKEAK